MKKCVSVIERAFDFLDVITENIGRMMIAVMLISTSANIALRWTTGRSYGQLDEISLMALCWTIYIGVGLLYRKKEHIAMDFILRTIPAAWTKAISLIDEIIGVVVSFCIAYLGVMLMLKSFSRTLNITHVPYSYMHLAAVIGFGCYALYAALDIAKSIAGLFKEGAE